MAADWILAPALVDLRGELNEIAPDRDKRSDGTIGDTAHQATSSKHNPNAQGVVRAFDCDKTGPWPGGVTFGELVNTVVARHRTGADSRLQNIIWNRQIISRSWDWSEWRPYDGANAHTEHAHFEVRDSATYWSDRRPWGLVEKWGDVAIDDADVQKIVKAVWGFDPGNNTTGATNGGMPLPGWTKAGDNATANPAWGISRAVVGTDVAYQIRDRVDQLLVQLKALTGQDFTDEAAIVSGVLAGLGGSTQSDAELAAALQVALGDRAAAVGQLLAAS